MTTHAATPSTADFKQIFTVLLNDRRLAAYYHFDVRPNRLPLRIVNQTSQALDLAGVLAAGQATTMAAQADKDSLVITALRTDKACVEVDFEFRPEGVLGNARFDKRGDQWSLSNLSLAER